jgi:hypothetical protein
VLGRVNAFHDFQVWEITWGYGVSGSGARLLGNKSRSPGGAAHPG